MAYTKLFDISTRETISGTRRVAQTVSVPTGRLDKVSLFLQGVVGESLTGNETTVQVAVYAVDSQYVPTGSPLAVDSKVVSEITTPSFYNFALSADVPTTSAVIVSLEGNSGNYVTWSYVNYERGGEPMAVDDGAGWQQDFYRKMSYAAYSMVVGAVTLDDERPYTTPDFDTSDARPDIEPDIIQSAEIQAGAASVLAANSREDFEAMTLWQGLIIGDTIAINVGTYVITLVVDHSGSMTWNDNNNTRIDFLKSFIDDIDTSLQNAATPSRYYLSLGARTKNGTWGSVNPWTEGFVEVLAGEEYDTTILVDGQQATLLVQKGAESWSFTTTLPEPLSDLGPLNQAIIGRSSGQTDDSSFVTTTIKDMKVDTPPGTNIFSDPLTSDLGWNFSDPADATFSPTLGLGLTASSGTDQVGSRGMTSSVGSSFTIKSTIKIDAASGFYDLTTGITAGRGTGYNQNPAGIWLVAGFEREMTPQVTFEILKFNGRKIAKMRLLLNEESQNGTMLQNVVLARNGVVIYEGLNEKVIDRGSSGVPLIEGTIYTYTIYSIDSAGNQSAIKTVTASPMSAPRFPMGLAGFKTVEEVILGTTDDDVGKRRIKLSWVHAASSSASLAYNKIYVMRREDRPPESVLDGTLVFSAESTDPLYNSPYYDFNDPLFIKSNYPCSGLTYYYAAFTENTSGAKCKFENARQSTVKISPSAKPWELVDPIVTPPDYDSTPPGIPLNVVASPGPSEIKLSWTAGIGAKRYEVYYGETEYPSPGIDPDTGLRIYTAPTVESSTPTTLSPIYSGSELSFVHRGLENYEPHYYVIVSYDAVDIPSAGVQTLSRPDDTVTYYIPPLVPEEFSADPYNAEAIVVRWKLSLPDATNVTAYHGEAVNVVAVVTFDDDEDAPFTSDLSLDETSRSAEGYSLSEMPRDVIIDTFGLGAYSDLVTSIQTAQNEAQAALESAQAAAENPDQNALAKESETVDTSGPTVQNQTTVDPTTLPAISVDKLSQQVIINPISAINFGRGKSYEPNITTGTIKIAPSSSIQNFTKSASCSFETSLSVTDRDTGATLAKVYGGHGKVIFNNPFGLSIKDDPPQRISRRTAWVQNCCCPGGESCFQATGDPVECPGGATTSNGLGWICEDVPGVYTILGGTFTFTIQATWKNLPITDPVNLELRILDASTGIQSTVTTLPGASADGVLYTATSFKAEEITDRAGNPSGYTTNFNKATVTLPSQNVPGDYVIEVTARYNGYSRTASLPVHYEHPLNIDIISKEFIPNGVDIAEQQARVYIGDPKWETSKKVPVPDGTLVKWTLIPGGSFKKTRPFYSTESLGGTGIKSVTNGGIAKNVFFGPGVDIEEFKCLTTEPCHDYEWYVVKAEVSAYGQTKIGYNVIYLNPTQGSERDMNRIFMRPEGGFSTDTIPCDGENVSTWEILGIAREDGDVTDMESGAYFHERVTSMSGLVPDLPDGTIVTIYVNAYAAIASASTRDRLRNSGIPEIKTDLTNSQFVKANYAKATIIDGKATFQVRLNALANGNPIEQPEELPVNMIYGQSLPYNSSPIVFYMTSVANLTVRGKTLTFWGGGRDLSYSAPPCWLSFTEPLGTRQT
jgi:hypothetical protein